MDAITLVIALVAAAGADAPVLPDGWTALPPAAPGTELIAGETARAVHGETGAGLVMRALDPASFGAAGERPADASAEPEAVLRVMRRAQDEDEIDLQLFFGPADGSDRRLARWVFTSPGREVEPARLWWQILWRTGDAYRHLVAWCPLDGGLPACVRALRELEAGIVADGPWPLLHAARTGSCDETTRVDRARAIRASRRFPAARDALRDAWATARGAGRVAGVPPEAALAMAELRTTGALYRLVDACVAATLARARECRVEDGPAPEDHAASAALQSALVACLDGRDDADATIARAVAPLLTP